MKPSIQLVLLFAVFALPTRLFADEQPNATASAKAVAPYVDDLTVAVAHVDLSRVAAGPLAEMIARFVPESKAEIAGFQTEAANRISRFLQAGGKDVYVTASVGGPGPLPRVLAVIPLAANADEKAIRAALDIPADSGRRLGDALVLRLPPTDNRPFEIRASQRPELAAALEAAGEGVAQAVVIPPAYTCRVVEELMPQLPKEIGGGPSSVLTRGISWAAVGIDLPPHLALHAVVKSQDGPAADALRGKWAEVLAFAGRQEEVRRILPRLDQVLLLLIPRVEGDRLLLTLDGKTASIDTLITAIEAPLGQAREAARRTQSMSNMKQIGLGTICYVDAHKHFPAAANCGPDGKPLLSWRVYILPYINEEPLFKQFHLSEPWDSPHNKTLIAKMPAIFRSPKSKAASGMTNYLAPVGNGALYATSRDEPTFAEIKDGTSHTIMLVEVDDLHAAAWTRPDDLAFNPADAKQAIGNLYADGFIAGFCDGSVRFLRRSIDAKTLAALFTRAGGEAIGPY